MFLLSISLFLGGCFDSSYDYTSDFKNVDENSKTGKEIDSSLSNRSLKGQFAFPSKIIPVKVDIIVIDDDFNENNVIEGVITQGSSLYSFSVDEFDYPSSLVKIRYVYRLQDSIQNFEMEFSQYASIADGCNPMISLASAIKAYRIKTLLEDDVFFFENADLKATRELYHILRLESDASGNVEALSYGYLGENFDSTFQKRFERLSLALGDEEYWWSYTSEEKIADVFVEDYRDGIISMNDSLMTFANYWSMAYKLPTCDSGAVHDTIKNPAELSAYFEEEFLCDKVQLENVFYYWRPLIALKEE